MVLELRAMAPGEELEPGAALRTTAGGPAGQILARPEPSELGHASIGVTLDIYSHVLPSMREDEAEKIDEGPRAALAG